MFGYSLTRPVHNQDYYYDIFNTCAKFQCDIEGWHTESGPGVFEAALEFSEIREMADRASLFKYAPGRAVLYRANLDLISGCQIHRQVRSYQVWHPTVLHGQAQARSAGQ